MMEPMACWLIVAKLMVDDRYYLVQQRAQLYERERVGRITEPLRTTAESKCLCEERTMKPGHVYNLNLFERGKDRT